MTVWTRRAFSARAALAGLSLVPKPVLGRTKSRIVVIGGGIGGATLAKYLAMSVTGIDVTIVEPNTLFTTCVFSNLCLAGMRSFGSITYGYDGLTRRDNIRVVHSAAVDVDSSARRVRLEDGTSLAYDRLVVSPGIAFDDAALRGLGDGAGATVIDAWREGTQTKALRAQLEAMKDGGTFVIAAPPDPSRCPRGPYQRASLVAYFLKQFKPRSKVLILDAKEAFLDQDLFEEGWKRHYPGMIEWLPARAVGAIEAIDIGARSIKASGGVFKGDVVNVIGAQTAGAIAHRAHLVDRTKWCPVDPFTFESKLQPAIHVIGDAADAGDMPKTAVAANSQAKTCAFAIAVALTGTQRAPGLLFDAGFTHIAGDDAVSNAASFDQDGNTIRIGETTASRVGESKDRRRHNVQLADGWFDSFMHDVFG